MSIYKRGKVWWIYFTYPDGRRVRKSTGTTNQQKALEYHDKLKSDFWDSQKTGKVKYTWNQAAIRWIKETSTKTDHKRDLAKLRYFDQFLGSKQLSEINADMIFAIIDELRIIAPGKKKGRSPATVNRYLALLRSILKRAVVWGYLDSAPPVKLSPEPQNRIKWLTYEQADDMLAELPDDLKALAGFSLSTGLRERNVTMLEWSQVNLNRKVAWIHSDQAKSKKAIGVPLSDTAVNILKSRQGIHPTLVFNHPNRISDRPEWRIIGKKYGIRWHDLRHTWASWHVQNGTPLNVLQELGGWSSFNLVLRYAHLAPEHLAGYVNNCGVNVQSVACTTPQIEVKTGVGGSSSNPQNH